MAEAVVLVHFLFVVFVVAGGLFALRWPRAAWLHLPAALWGAVVVTWQLPCPLTELEFALDPGRPERGFIARLLLPLLYPGLDGTALSRGQAIGLGVAVVFVNAGIYAVVVRRSLRRRRLAAGAAEAAPAP